MDKRRVTVEELYLSDVSQKSLKELSKEKRKALYEWFTGIAYRANKEEIRSSAIWMRNELMKDTLGDNNGIDFDNLPDVKPMKEFLPAVYR